MLNRWQRRRVAIQEKRLIYIQRGFKYPCLQRRCCSNISFSSGLSDAQRGGELALPSTTPLVDAVPFPDLYGPLVVVLAGSNKEEWITFGSVLLPFHDEDLSSPRL